MRGFTLIEIVVVVGILAIVGTASAVVGLESYRGTLSRSDRNTLRDALMHARTEVLHGVPADPDADTGGVVFEAFSGDVVAPKDIILRGADGRMSTTSVNSEGAITQEP